MSGSNRALIPAALAAALTACIGSYRVTSVPAGRPCATPTSGTLAWYVPADAGERRSGDAWCAAVGPPVLDTVPARDAWTASADSLRLFVWNVSAGGGDLEGFLRREAGASCGEGGSAAPPFVLLAQEAYRRSEAVPPPAEGARVAAPAAEKTRAGSRDDVVAVARRCGLALVYVPAVRNGGAEYPDGREDRGNAMLANVPLHDVVAIELPAEDSRRLAVGATVRPPSGDSLRLVTLHFTLLPKLWRNLTHGNAARVRHALGMLDALSRIEAARGTEGAMPTVAAGDANTWSQDDAALQRLRAAFPDSPPRLAAPTRGAYPADHLLYRRAADGSGGGVIADTYRRFDADYGSDHHPLAATYVFR